MAMVSGDGNFVLGVKKVRELDKIVEI